jgi:hypothetical protein
MGVVKKDRFEMNDIALVMLKKLEMNVMRCGQANQI